MHLDIDGTGGAFMASLRQLKRFEARISLFKSLDCPLALAAAGRNQRFTRYPPVINHNLGWCNYIHKESWNVITPPCLDSDGGLTKVLLKLGMNDKLHCTEKLRMQLLIHVLLSHKLCVQIIPWQQWKSRLALIWKYISPQSQVDAIL